MTVEQSQFRAALLDPLQPVPDDLLGPDGRPGTDRFSVYRNTVTVSLRDALGVAFPLVAKLIGPRNFRPLALDYARAHPPTSPLMMHYGASFPEYLAGVAALSHIGYLPDCARLDLAMRRSYHAADATPLSQARLAIDTPGLMALRLALMPATQVIRSQWPLHDIWAFNFVPDAPKPRAVAQDVLITRPEFDPAPHPLPPGGAAWLDALGRGQPFGAAHDAAVADTPGFDLAQTLALALSTSALADAPPQKGLMNE
ncbi:DNA-binding domain-containing protein [Sulfitobacter sabulilitoris]|uniref:DUF2063 domain-containing protein n=1 Tax=Sulfitobacter sabulilitoris TaxID=2562655 RepID=A0A5S3PDD2_9RHOB|nr:DNA-binding domain-containing protein [Sulfitobacter sabulilitoris]TMM50867.1 DUF2063 domain-containing protein [Sulfitobacter sabulilitoris]